MKTVRFSLSGYREQDWMRNVPLYAISCRALWGNMTEGGMVAVWRDCEIKGDM